MQRPSVELADVIRAAGPAFAARSRSWFTWLHLKVLVAILRCRTGLLGGHVDACSRCGHQAISYNSCRNRHCPRCQTRARDRWVEARVRDLLPTGYAHVVFTLHHALAPLALQNKAAVYDLLMARRSDSSAFSIPGTRNCNFTLTSTVSFRPVGWPWTTAAGYQPRRTSFCR
jgi:hypothetical protein